MATHLLIPINDVEEMYEGIKAKKVGKLSAIELALDGKLDVLNWVKSQKSVSLTDEDIETIAKEYADNNLFPNGHSGYSAMKTIYSQALKNLRDGK